MENKEMASQIFIGSSSAHGKKHKTAYLKIEQGDNVGAQVLLTVHQN